MIKTIRNLISDKDFLKMTIALSIPIVFQNLLNNSINLVDTFMVSRLTTASVSAVGFANKFYYMFVCVIFGFASGHNIFAAQFFGANKMDKFKKVYSITLISGMAIGLVFFLLTFLKPYLVIRLFTNNPSIIAEGIKYLKIVSLTYLLQPMILAHMFSLRSMRVVKVAVYVAVVSLIINMIFNFLLIEGNFGFPRLELRGAAIATCIAVIFELTAYTVYVFLINKKIFNNVTELFNFDFKLFIEMFPYSIPVVTNEILWGAGVTAYFMAFGRLSQDSIAAITIMNVIQDLLYTLYIGIGSSAATVIGNLLGNNELDKAKTYGNYFVILTFVTSFVIAISLFIFEPLTALLYKNCGENCLNILKQLFMVTIICTIPRSLDFLLVCGILRPGGDTKIAFFLDCGTLWLFSVLPAFLGVFVLKLDTVYAYFFANIDCFVKAILCLIRYFQYKWVKQII